MGQWPTDNNIGATFNTVSHTTTYAFTSFTNENPANGVPGLIGYCVYPSSQPNQPTSMSASPANWTAIAGNDSSAFTRKGGDKTNIPLDGSGTTVVGTATWNTVPQSQTIVLHVNDPGVCGTALTCWVLPGTGAPICNHGDASIAFNAIPDGGVNCRNPAFAFEANSTTEFGNQVGLASTTGELKSMQVLFNSYGCNVSGHWNLGDCVSSPTGNATDGTPGPTFTIPITANIYAVGAGGTPGTLLATVTQSQTIPYRPSADNVNCTGADAGKWFNTVAQACQNSLGVILTFSFPSGITLPSAVIWTVSFDTTHYGSPPLGAQTCSTAVENATVTPPDPNPAPGCGYDSLNVGTMTFPNAPYAGTSDINFVHRQDDVSAWVLEDGTGFTPLAAITLG